MDIIEWVKRQECDYIMCKYDNYINQTKHYSVCESNKAIMSTVENKYFIISI